jgi:hypothetical protein
MLSGENLMHNISSMNDSSSLFIGMNTIFMIENKPLGGEKMEIYKYDDDDFGDDDGDGDDSDDW